MDTWNRIIGLKNKQDMMTNCCENDPKDMCPMGKIGIKRNTYYDRKRFNWTYGDDVAGIMKLVIRILSQWWVCQRENSLLLSPGGLSW